MEEAQWTVTRREILKRGAIVGGGVLWIAPVVQTLGMGSAYASAVSGDSCDMTMEIAACGPHPNYLGMAAFTFKTCVPSGCPCNPLPVDHVVHMYAIVPDGTVTRISASEVVGEPGCYAIELVLWGPIEIYAQCGTMSEYATEIDGVTAESVHLQVTADDFSACMGA